MTVTEFMKELEKHSWLCDAFGFIRTADARCYCPIIAVANAHEELFDNGEYIEAGVLLGLPPLFVSDVVDAADNNPGIRYTNELRRALLDLCARPVLTARS